MKSERVPTAGPFVGVEFETGYITDNPLFEPLPSTQCKKNPFATSHQVI